MTEPPKKEKQYFGFQGLDQFLNQRKSMLNRFWEAKKYAEAKGVQVSHGNVAEAELRRWLEEFLPKRYAVTSGYIISHAFQEDAKLRHFDVIIYDCLGAPVLWVEPNADSSEQGKVRAIPVEYVLAVLEVKSTFNSKSTSDALRKLEELRPLLSLDDPRETYKKYLPPNFCCGVVFFELPHSERNNTKAPSFLLPSNTLRGYFGGFIISGGDDEHASAEIGFLAGKDHLEAISTSLHSMHVSKSIQYEDGLHHSAMIFWSLSAFSSFAFGLIKRMEGTFEANRAPSFYGVAFLGPGWK